MLSSHFGQFERRRIGWVVGRRSQWLSLLLVVAGSSVAGGVEHRDQSHNSWTISASQTADSRTAVDLQQRMILDTLLPWPGPLVTGPSSLPPARPAPSAASGMK